MKRFKQIFLLCGIVLTLAAFPVFAQEDRSPKINKKPLQDFGAKVLSQVQNKEVDLSENFLVEVSGEITKGGKLAPQKTQYIRSEGDEKMIAVAKSAIEAINDNGIFIYLSQLGIDKISLILEQNDNEISAVIRGDTTSANRARSIESMLNMAVSAVKENAKTDDDSRVILGGTKVSANEKSVTIKTAVEKSVGQEMIQRHLNKETERREKAKAGR